MPYIGSSPSNGVRRVHTYTATASQTTFSGAGSEGATLSYKDTTFVDVFQNGVLLGSADYTATSGTSIVLVQAASVDDLVVVIAYDVFSVADTVSKSDGGTFDGAVTVSGAFTSQGIDDNADANAITIDSSEQVGIGTTSPADKLHISKGSSGISSFAANTQVIMEDDGNVALQLASPNTATQQILFSDPESNIAGVIKYDHSNNSMSFFTGEGTNERLFIANNGTILTNKTDVSVAVVGAAFYSGGHGAFTRASGIALIANRTTNDGQVVSIRQDNTQEGAISVSGSTVSYTSFTGTHWSRLTDNSKPTILRGTVIETIDEMCDWYQVQFTVKPTDGTSNYVEKVSIALPKGKKVGDKITYKHNDITYKDAEIIKENDEKHTKCQISDTEDSKRVYGVFMDWDNDDDSVNDMFVMAVGTGVVRISKDITVNAGDLLSSKGDGTAKVQDDDIVRSKTIGKVLTNIKQETYDDGSYTVPCALYCG